MTKEQKEKVPYEAWWENNRKGKEYIRQSQKHPATLEEVIAQQRRLNASVGKKDNFLNSWQNQQNETERG